VSDNKKNEDCCDYLISMIIIASLDDNDSILKLDNFMSDKKIESALKIGYMGICMCSTGYRLRGLKNFTWKECGRTFAERIMLEGMFVELHFGNFMEYFNSLPWRKDTLLLTNDCRDWGDIDKAHKWDTFLIAK